MARFDTTRKRLKRAQIHRMAFLNEWNSILAGNHYSFETYLSEDRKSGEAHAVRDTPLPENTLAIQLGEFFYQLRAALDSLMYEAVAIKTTNPPADAEYLYFPICRNAATYKGKRTYFRKLPKPLRDWLRSLQEYCRHEVKGTADEAIGAFLTLLNECASSDRHRQLHVVAALPQNVKGTIRLSSTAKVTEYEIIECNLLDNESLFMRFDIEGDFVGEPYFIHTEFNVDLSVREVPATSGEELNNVLYSMQVVVGTILNRFERDIDL